MADLIIKIWRDRPMSKSMGGRLECENFTCYTLEPHPTDPVNAGHPCAPAGRWKAVLEPAPILGERQRELMDASFSDLIREKKITRNTTLELKGIPGRSEIKFHPLNEPAQTLGCIGLGANICENWISLSGVTWIKFLKIVIPRLLAGDACFVEIVDKYKEAK